MAYAQALGAVAPGSLVGYPWRPHPEAVAADLGIQAAGAVAVAAAPDEGGHQEGGLPPLARWLAIDGAAGPPGVAAIAVAADAGNRDRGEDGAGSPALAAASGAGALVRDGDVWLPWRDREAVVAARSLARAASRREGRPIVLVSGELGAAPERAWLAWSLAAGGCLVLPGDTSLAAWGLWWPRPTDACLRVEALAGVRALLATLGRPRRCRRQLGRLRRLLVWAGEPASEEIAAWAELGVALQQFPGGNALR